MDPAGLAPDATLGREAPGLSHWSQGAGAEPLGPVELDDGDATLAGGDPEGATLRSGSALAAARTTVLPRRRRVLGSAPAPQAEERARFEELRQLGEGAMGEVALVRDNDIRRTVAVKRIKGDAGRESNLLRFADEVRIVGQLEHPGIVPIYDVGRDEAGRLYLVMKHLQGQTMEEILEALRAGDPSAHERFPISVRAHLFMGVLDAIRYAHSRGIVHRDLKPANIMIGPYGEVTVLDWGIAKPVRKGEEEAPVGPLDSTIGQSHDQRLLETQVGSLAGTPLYMSPEQAAGRNHEIDERSDVYTLCVVLSEWLMLRHPLGEKRTVTEVLAAILTHDYTADEFRGPSAKAGVPTEYAHVLLDGLQRDPAKRLQSVAELESRLQDVFAGVVAVRCHVTFAKYLLSGFSRWIDRHPHAFTLTGGALLLLTLGGIVAGVARALG